MKPSHCRAARGLLDWTIKDLAARSKVSEAQIIRFENDKPTGPLYVAALRGALEAGGIKFVPNGVQMP